MKGKAEEVGAEMLFVVGTRELPRFPGSDIIYGASDAY